MTWEWSHTPEAYASARANLFNVEPETLREIFSEWKGHLCNETAGLTGDLCIFCFADAQDEAARLSVEQLVDFIWMQAEELRSCDNGGWRAHMCPYGCDCHKVSFDNEEGDQ